MPLVQLAFDKTAAGMHLARDATDDPASNRSSIECLQSPPTRGVVRLLLAAGLLLVSLAVTTLLVGGGASGTALLEGDADSAYGRALSQIRSGRDIASEGHFRRAATHFLRAKDLWEVSGVPG